jgi:hypothetical protein
MSRWLLGAVLTALASSALIARAAPAGAASDGLNPVVTENRLQGSSGWRIPSAGNAVADDVLGQIKGYASSTSVNQGESISFHVSVTPPQSFTMEVYRLGWYGGEGGRLVRSVGPIDGIEQPSCPMDAQTGLAECRWAQSMSLDVPSDWVSGLYVGVLTNANHYQNYVIFTVRDDARRSDLLFQQAVATYQAYNNYPAGKSFYESNSSGPATIAGSSRAVKVSFDRPYSGNGAGDLFRWEANFVAWMEQTGYDVTYSTDVDTHAHPDRLLLHRGLLSVGHDEYWSKEMVDGWEAARDSGHHLGFFGADAAYFQVRFEPSASGALHRVMVCYKSMALDPVKGAAATDLFRYIGRSEQQLIGVQYSSYNANPSPFVVQNASHWVYAGSGFRDGDAVPGLVGIESDRFYTLNATPRATSHTLLSWSPVTSYLGAADYSNASVYQAPSGAWVFAAATRRWSWALSALPDHGMSTDSRIQRVTATILDRFVAADSVTAPQVPAPGATRSGYWMLGRDGRVFGFGHATNFGDAHPGPGRRATRLRPTPSSGGYWITDDVGNVSAFGDATTFGSLPNGALHPGESVTSLSPTRSGRGYWLFTTEGRVFTFGDAMFFGDLGGHPLQGPVVASTVSASGGGYYMVASDGGVFTFGDATFLGSMGGTRLNGPVRSLVPTASGRGYWLVASDGGVFTFGDATFLGSMGGRALNKPVVGLVRFGSGYLMVAADGGIFNFSDRPFLGSLGADPPATPIAAAATLSG